jgi:hypothetical protein
MPLLSRVVMGWNIVRIGSSLRQTSTGEPRRREGYIEPVLTIPGADLLDMHEPAPLAAHEEKENAFKECAPAFCVRRR